MDSEAYNAVWTAIEQCGKDTAESKGKRTEGALTGSASTYDWLEETPRASLTVALVNKLKELGYQITKIQEDSNV